MEGGVMESNPSLLDQALLVFGQRLANVEQVLTEIHEVVMNERVEKEWYTKDGSIARKILTPESGEYRGTSIAGLGAAAN